MTAKTFLVSLMVLATIGSQGSTEAFGLFGTAHRFPHFRPHARMPSLFDRFPSSFENDHFLKHNRPAYRTPHPNYRVPQVVPRQYDIRDAGDHFEIHIQSNERMKNGLFSFDVDLSIPSIKVVDRVDSRRFDKLFQLPDGVTQNDIFVKYNSDRVILLINKPVEQDLHHSSASPTLPKDDVPPSSPQEKKSEPAQNQERIEEDPEGLFVSQDDMTESVDCSEDPADVSSGYYDNRGVFHHY